MVSLSNHERNQFFEAPINISINPKPMTKSRLQAKIMALVLSSLLFMAYLPCHSGEIIRGRVVGVHDGDTLTLLTGSKQLFKIRLAQIDAPESDQPFGQVSRQTLASLVFNKTVGVAVDTLDAHDRIVGMVFVDGVDINREQIRRGMAWAYRQYLHDQSLLQLEGQARRAKLGLWTDANPMPPWVYRHGGKAYSEQSTDSQPTPAPTQSTGVSCGSKRTCKEMASCEEAKQYLANCGLSHLDRDKDGVPCESLCGNGQ